MLPCTDAASSLMNLRVLATLRKPHFRLSSERAFLLVAQLSGVMGSVAI
jgi:hypothetical protein